MVICRSFDFSRNTQNTTIHMCVLLSFTYMIGSLKSSHIDPYSILSGFEELQYNHLMRLW